MKRKGILNHYHHPREEVIQNWFCAMVLDIQNKTQRMLEEADNDDDAMQKEQSHNHLKFEGLSFFGVWRIDGDEFPPPSLHSGIIL